MRKVSHFVWVLMLGALVALSLIPRLLTTPGDSDKDLHVLAYSLLMIPPIVLFSSLRAQIFAGAGLMGIGVLNEVLQQVVGGRDASVKDVLANLCGIALGFFLGRLVRSGLDAHPHRSLLWVCGIAVAAASGGAGAQPFSPDSVFLPSPPPVSAEKTVGLPVGAWMMSPRIRIENILRDNVFLTRDNPSADWIRLVKPAVAVQTNWARHFLYAAGGAEQASHKRYGRKNYTDYGFFLTGRYDLAPKTDLTGMVERARRHYGRGAGEDQAGEDSVSYLTTKLGAGFARTLSYLQLNLTTLHEEAELESDRFRLGTGDYTRKTTNFFQSVLTLETMPENGPFLDLSYAVTDYDLLDAAATRARKLNTKLGFRFDTGGLYAGTLFGGYLWRRHEGEIELERQPYIGASLLWRVTPLTTLFLTTNRFFSEPTVSGTGGAVTSFYLLEGKSALTTRMTGGFSLRYDDNDYSLDGSEHKNKVLDAGVETNYRVSDNLSADLEYGHRRRASSIEAEENADNRLVFSLNYMH